MRKVFLSKLHIQNFKGCKNEIVEFDQITNITRPNRGGKTTIADAWHWLLFGKDSQGNSDFEIKTRKNGVTIPKLVHSVEGWFDGISLKREYREKYVRKRGNEEETFDGHETTYFIDSVPVSMSEYKTFISSIVSEPTFKLITSPVAFMELKPDVRRETLAAMVTIEEPKGFEETIALISGKKLADLRIKINAELKPIKEELNTIPAKIEENQLRITGENYSDTKAQIEKETAALSKIESEIQSEVEATRGRNAKVIEAVNQKRDLENKRYELNRNRQDEERIQNDKASANYRNAQRSTNEAKDERNGLIRNIESKKGIIAQNEGKLAVLRDSQKQLAAEYKELNEKQAPEYNGEKECPHCKQSLPEAQIQELTYSFTGKWNTDKVAKLNNLKEQGATNKGQIEFLMNENQSHQARITEFEKRIKDLNDIIEINSETKSPEPVSLPKSKEEIELETQIADFIIPTEELPNTAELNARKSEIQTRIDELKGILRDEQTENEAKDRIKQLAAQQKDLQTQMAEKERILKQFDKYEKVKNEAIESEINKLFTFCQWRLFKPQINGGYENVCDCLVNGVPFFSVNTEGRLNAGIDIINVLSKFYDVSVPVFIDNRESVTEIIQTEAQVINLIVGEVK